MGAVHIEEEDEFIGVVRAQVPTIEMDNKTGWLTTLSLNGSPFEFKIDTEADVSTISEKMVLTCIRWS